MSFYTPPFFSDRTVLEKELGYTILPREEFSLDAVERYIVYLGEEVDILNKAHEKEISSIQKSIDQLILIVSDICGYLNENTCNSTRAFCRALKSYIKFCYSKEEAIKQHVLADSTMTSDQSRIKSKIQYIVQSRPLSSQISFVIDMIACEYKKVIEEKDILSFLYEKALNHALDHESISGLVKNLFSETFEPYANTLALWIFEGLLPPEESKFMVVYENNAYVLNQPQHIPTFLLQIKEIVLYCGLMAKKLNQRSKKVIGYPKLSLLWSNPSIYQKDIEFGIYFGKQMPNGSCYEHGDIPVISSIQRCIINPIHSQYENLRRITKEEL